jgi:hypothetical protein
VGSAATGLAANEPTGAPRPAEHARTTGAGLVCHTLQERGTNAARWGVAAWLGRRDPLGRRPQRH